MQVSWFKWFVDHTVTLLIFPPPTLPTPSYKDVKRGSMNGRARGHLDSHPHMALTEMMKWTLDSY